LPSEIVISDRVRQELKDPLGRLIKDSDLTKSLLADYFADRRMTVCVGDRTTERVHEFGFSPTLEIVDSLEKRASRKIPKVFEKERLIFKASNPPGSISDDALEKLGESLQIIQKSRKQIRLEVQGEEDLLALPVLAFFPEDTVLFYGQPNEGMVIVISKIAREKALEILREMGISSFFRSKTKATS
jgi:GTP-dependent dephospho-CoA kinase